MIEFDPKFGWSTLVQAFGFVAAIWGVTYQLRKQRELAKDKNRSEFVFSTYEKITTNIENSSPTGVAMSLNILAGALAEARNNIEERGRYLPPPFSPTDFNEDFKRVHSQLWLVASTLEKYEISAPNLPVFRKALVIKLKELVTAYLPIIAVLPHLLISEGGIERAEDLVIVTDEDMRKLDELVRDFSNVAYDVAGFLHDIQVELQNQFLGPLFGRSLEVRLPSSEEYLVLTSADAAMLEKVKSYIAKAGT